MNVRDLGLFAAGCVFGAGTFGLFAFFRPAPLAQSLEVAGRDARKSSSALITAVDLPPADQPQTNVHSSGIPDWERTLATEMEQVASEMQILDDPNAYKRAVGHLKQCLGSCSVEELSDMLKSLSDPATSSIQRAVMMAAAVTAMASIKPEAALQFMKDNGTGEKGNGIAFFVFSEIARTNPEFLSAWFSKSTLDWKNPTEDLREGLKALASVSADKAFSLIAAAPASVDRTALYAEVFRQLGETNFESAFAHLQTLDPKYRSTAISEIAKGLSKTDPAAAIDWLKRNKDTPLPPAGLQTIFDTWLATNKEAAVESLKSLPESMLLGVLSSVSTMDRLQRKDPAAALDLLTRITPTRSNEHVLLQNLSWMLLHVPDQVVAWLDTQAADGVNSPLQSNLYSIWAQRDPENAYLALKSRSTLLQDPSIVRGLAQGMASHRLTNSLTWSENLPREQRDQFLQALVSFAAEKQPRNVVEYLASHPDRGTPEVYRKVGASLATLDPKEAANWSLRQAGRNGEAAVSGLVAGWAKSDAQSASIWLAELPDGPLRDAGVKVLVDEVSGSDPVAAAEWRKLLKPTQQ